MVFSIVFLAVIITLLFSKLKDISLRNKLNTQEDKRLIIAGMLIVLFLTSSILLPYPESIYWFAFIGVILTGFILCFDILKAEMRRFEKLNVKDKLTNILFYSLMVIVIHIYI